MNCKCEPVYIRHDWKPKYARAAYHIVCKNCGKHIKWMSSKYKEHVMKNYKRGS